MIRLRGGRHSPSSTVTRVRGERQRAQRGSLEKNLAVQDCQGSFLQVVWLLLGLEAHVRELLENPGSTSDDAGSRKYKLCRIYARLETYTARTHAVQEAKSPSSLMSRYGFESSSPDIVRGRITTSAPLSPLFRGGRHASLQVASRVLRHLRMMRGGRSTTHRCGSRSCESGTTERLYMRHLP